MVEVAHAHATADVIGYGCWRLSLDQVERLTPREHEVFLLLADGWPYRRMADLLYVSERTIRAHLSAIVDKLGFDSVLHARLASYGYKMRHDELEAGGRPGEDGSGN
ncbi:helix-turn-helix domain-containing protein [Sphaerisporangium dianthi]|uniref:Helix-turn-helix transcriptional regulator n=1 Tax=Sphaerisporangium dianthi TaxID=1436120 RepID=A0ABV9CSU4_9ACTN